jgi:hypothetical protein
VRTPILSVKFILKKNKKSFVIFFFVEGGSKLCGFFFGMVPRVIIIGAGVAGSTLGRALVRAGIPCRVFDSAPGHNRQPRGLGLWNNRFSLGLTWL